MTSQPAGTVAGPKPQGPLPPLLLTLTVVTGVVDAVSILRLGRDRGLLLGPGAGAELVLVAGALALTAALPGAAARDGIAALLALATGLLAVVTAGAALATRQPGPWRAGDQSRPRAEVAGG
jgi:hypothetical protein